MLESTDSKKFRGQLAELLGSIEGVRLVLVSDARGATVDSSGSSKTLGSPEDFELLLAARSVAGVAITTAKTAVAEQLNQSALCPILVVFGETDPGHFPGRTTHEPTKHSLHLMNRGKRHSVAAILNAADNLRRSTGRPGFLLESGLTLAREFAAIGVIREVALSVKTSDWDEPHTSKLLSEHLNISPSKIQLKVAGQLGEHHILSIWNIGA